MRLIKSKSDTIHKLEIPRNQFDRIADAFEATVIDVNGFDFEKDTIIFTISEEQRKMFEKCALKKDNPKVKLYLKTIFFKTIFLFLWKIK